jgi:hypothetical protein
MNKVESQIRAIGRKYAAWHHANLTGKPLAKMRDWRIAYAVTGSKGSDLVPVRVGLMTKGQAQYAYFSHNIQDENRCILMGYSTYMALDFGDTEVSEALSSLIGRIYDKKLGGLIIGDCDCGECGGPAWAVVSKSWRDLEQNTMITLCLFCGSVILGDLDMKPLSGVYYNHRYFTPSFVIGATVKPL